jgi:hypothetical protein
MWVVLLSQRRIHLGSIVLFKIRISSPLIP